MVVLINITETEQGAMVQLAQNVQTNTSGLFIPSVLVIWWIVLFSYTRKFGLPQAFFYSSFMTFMVTAAFRAMELVTNGPMIFSFVILILSILYAWVGS